MFDYPQKYYTYIDTCTVGYDTYNYQWNSSVEIPKEICFVLDKCAKAYIEAMSLFKAKFAGTPLICGDLPEYNNRYFKITGTFKRA